MTKKFQNIMAENQKLTNALAALIPWAEKSPEGPDWVTPEAKARNRAMCEKALSDACKCFPDDYNNSVENTNQTKTVIGTRKSGVPSRQQVYEIIEEENDNLIKHNPIIQRIINVHHNLKLFNEYY